VLFKDISGEHTFKFFRISDPRIFILQHLFHKAKPTVEFIHIIRAIFSNIFHRYWRTYLTFFSRDWLFIYISIAAPASYLYRHLVRAAAPFIVTSTSLFCLARFQSSAAVHMRSEIFCDITWRRLVVIYRRFETTCRFHCQASSTPGPLMKGLIVFRQVTIHLRRLIYQKGKDLTSSII
jgi:hypothetical protein